jgi:anaerobic selenocysteine-containing dehydrogenase
MSPTRREFVWTTGAAGAALALSRAHGILWTTADDEQVGWEPGIEERLSSACLVCPARCGIRGRLVDGRLVEITGNPLHPMSRGGVCPRGLAGVQVLYHPQRLASPLQRVGPRGSGDWREISRDEALAIVGERLRDLRVGGRPEALALLSGYCAGTMSDLWRQFLGSFGSPNYVPDEHDDATEVIMSLVHGIPRRPSYDLERAELVLSFGAPLFESWWSPLQALVAYAGRGSGDGARPRFIQVDTRLSRTAAGAHEWVGVRPGTHAALALGIAYVLIRDELIDDEFIAQRVEGFEDFTDARGRRRDGYRSLVMRDYRTEEVSASTGVSVERITSLARAFARSQPALAVLGSEVTRSPEGLLAGLAVHSLNVLVGSVSRPGGVMFGDDPPLEPLARPVLDPTARAGLGREQIGDPGAPFGGGDRALRFAETVAGSSNPVVEVLLVYYANPLASSDRPEIWQDALDRIPFVVSFSPFLDETSGHADVIIPDLLPYERWQDAPTPPSYPYPVWGLCRPLVEPHEGGTHTGDAVLALARNLGGSVAESLPFDGFEAAVKARARGLFAARRGMLLGDEFERRHHRQMEQRGWWLPEHSHFERFWEDLVERGGWTDLFYDDTDPARVSRRPGGRIHLMPEELLQALEEQGSAGAPYSRVARTSSAAELEFPLLLIPYRLFTLASGTLTLEPWLAEQPAVFPEVFWGPWVEVNPETAETLGLADHTMVWVVSARGRYRARLKVFPGTARENVCAPYRLRHPDGEVANPRRLLDNSRDRLTGLASWYTTRVRLERA